MVRRVPLGQTRMGRGGLGAAGEALRSRSDRIPADRIPADRIPDGSHDLGGSRVEEANIVPEFREPALAAGRGTRSDEGRVGGDGATAAEIPDVDSAPRERRRTTRTTAPQRRDAAQGNRAPALGGKGQSLLGRLFGSLRSVAGADADSGRRRAGGAATREAPVIAIASGKGGTGKSFLSTSLAIAFHRMGHRTTLVDCDFGLACDHLLLGVKPTRHLRHLVTGDAGIEEVRVPTPHGPNLIPGVTGVRQMAQLADHEVDAVGRAISRTAEDQDVVLLDSGAGITPQACAFLCAADHVVLVTNPEIAALTDAYAMVKTLRQLGARSSISVVVNRVLEAGHGESTYQKLDEVAGRHAGTTLHFLGSIADDPAVTQRRLDQVPLIASEPDRETSRALRAIARRLGSLVAPLEPRHRDANEGFADRLAAHARIC